MTTEPLPDELVAEPSSPETGVGALVLSGSSGRVEHDRARVLAGLGAVALTYRWFGAPGQPRGICEYPLESFGPAVERLAARCDRVVLVGTSKSAEALLLYAAHDPRIDSVIALAPSHVVWANVGPGVDGLLRPCRSSWALGGAPVAFVPYDDDLEVVGNPPSYLPLYQQSLRTFAAEADAARIPVERISGHVLLVAGEDDLLWPSAGSAREIGARRTAYGLPTTVVTHPRAGHRVILPGEGVTTGGMHLARGGSESADRELGRLAWPEIARVLGSRV